MAYLELRDVYFEYPSGHIAVEGVSISADLGEKNSDYRRKRSRKNNNRKAYERSA